MPRGKYEKIAIKQMFKPINFVATGFGVGLSPIAPGTLGTIIAVVIYIFFWRHLAFFAYALILMVAIFIAVLICERTSKALGVSDHPAIVVDEFVGYWLTMFSIPPNILTITLGFILFRVFDIVKPWPIRWCDKNVKGGVGIVLDDLIAGFFALILLKLFVQLTM